MHSLRTKQRRYKLDFSPIEKSLFNVCKAPGSIPSTVKIMNTHQNIDSTRGKMLLQNQRTVQLEDG